MRPLRIVPAVRFIAVFAVTCCLLPGCLLVRITDHRIKINDDGSGDAVLRLIDIRSDGTTDSALVNDCERLRSSLGKAENVEFEREGRKVVDKRLYVEGDTLIGEISYKFPNLDGIYGLHVTRDKFFILVPEDREVLRSNGKIEPWTHNSTRIVWDSNAKRLMFQIREMNLPHSTSLARLYSGKRP